MSLNYIIIEDNPGALANLRGALKYHDEFVEIGFASSVNEGINLIHTQKPHFVFLDVELGDKNGFDVLNEIQKNDSQLPFFIMTTDYVKYAREAVNKSVLYFLEKPIDPDELDLALIKVQKQFLELQSHIVFKTSEGHLFVDLKNITHIEADNNACYVNQQSKRPILVIKTLKTMEDILPSNFIRVHKSFIVNKKYVYLLNTSKKMISIQMNSEIEEIPIGNSYLESVKNSLLIH